MPTKLDRRAFVQQSSLLAASGALLATGAARAADTAANDVVLGVMGVNGRGHALATEFATLPGVRLAYVCDVDDAAAARTADSLAGTQGERPATVRDFRRVLDDQAVTALVIAAPDHWHAPAAILACAAGKHVYVEKPACHNPQEGVWLVDAARKHNRVVQLGTQRRSTDGIRQAVERVHQGEIGRALFARSWINSTRPSIGRGREAAVPDRLDYALWQGPAPAEPYRDNVIHYHWHWFWNWGTGELGNNGIHGLDICRWGLQVEAPNRVVCGGGKYFFDDDQQTPDTQLATFEFGDKAITWEHRTWNKRGFENSSFGIGFYGDQGSLVITQNEYQVYDKEGKSTDKASFKLGEMEHLQNFLAAIRSGEPLNAPIEEGVRSTLLCHLGNIAYRTGRTVNYDPKAGKITGDDQQAALWRREYAPGWEPRV